MPWCVFCTLAFAATHPFVHTEQPWTLMKQIPWTVMAKSNPKKEKKGQICDVVGGVSLTAQFIYHKAGGEDVLITYTHHEEATRKNGEIWEGRRMRWRKREWWERRRRDRKIKERGELVVCVFVKRDNWAFSSTLPMTGVTFSIGAHTLLSVCVCVQVLSPLYSISIKHTQKHLLQPFILITNGQEAKMCVCVPLPHTLLFTMLTGTRFDQKDIYHRCTENF